MSKTRTISPTLEQASIPADEPPLDTVVVWLTLTVERDYSIRKVFPELRVTDAMRPTTGASLHYLTLHEAAAVHADAVARLKEVGKGLRNAFKSHANKLASAIDEARKRQSEFDAAAPVCTYKSSYSEDWRGTKKQLQSIGIGVGAAFPGDPDFRKRWCAVRDRRGYEVRLRKASTVWSGLFDARIQFPREVAEANEQAANDARKVQTSAQDRIKHLKSMPQTVEDFKTSVAEMFWSLGNIVKGMMKPKDGFRFTDDDVEEFTEALTEMYWALKRGDTEGTAPSVLLMEALRKGAKSDTQLQSFLASVNPDGAPLQ